MKLKEVLDKTTAFFKDKKLETPRLDAELLFAHSLKLERIQLYLKFDQPLSEAELAGLRELVRRRGQGEPVAYILGYRDFYKSRFEVSPATLIPRPETEQIVEEALAWAKDKDQAYTLLDLGTGTGCLGLSILKELPNAKLVSVDVSADAIAVAKRNAQSLGLADRVEFVNGDASNVDLVMASCRNFMGQNTLDILVSNPPYIANDDPAVQENVRKFEPSTALFAEDNGLALLKSWSKAYAPYLSSESVMMMEMGMSQGSAMQSYYSDLNIFKNVRVLKDLSGLDRVIAGVKHG
ncbi:peptide chain release factor N(5)-glutamine methyltransferase [Bdellovibrio sp. ZAP7]|uniref:peptide chain release factor N(5)-glutamine methyltransferase n=1 Tax=Bdellovibrio sp. ZAP7 TaxID=2231053 RepID=UPI0011588DE4|nr:peptide chain release factor N(5)-glutamine methyltransferase [Bdellovibrio sp. ZAP7]QDK43722.1 peptide chain release factor N(5)-glutamine methyltransferase [Bdellovibrio sp. ZAP7]